MALKMPNGHMVQMEWTLTDDSDATIHSNKPLSTVEAIEDQDDYTLYIASLLCNYAHMYELCEQGDYPVAFACFHSEKHDTVYVVLVRVTPPDYYTVRNITWGLPTKIEEFKKEARYMISYCMDHEDDWPRLRG